MKTKLSGKRIIFLSAFLALLICLGNFACAVVLDGKKDETEKTFSQVADVAAQQKETPQYAPNQIIVKFKENSSINCELYAVNEQIVNTQVALDEKIINTVSSAIPDLKIKKMEKVFKDMPLKASQLNSLNAQGNIAEDRFFLP